MNPQTKASQLFVGIDPGLHGAVAIIGDQGTLFNIWDTPVTVVKTGKKSRTVYLTASMVDGLRNVEKRRKYSTVIGLEEVHAMPDQGVTSMFSMGKGAGLWEGIITALGFPLVRITPQRWKHKMLADGKGKDKQASIVRALELFPAAAPFLTRKRDEGRAEALLIAEYLRRGGTASVSAEPPLSTHLGGPRSVRRSRGRG